MFLAVLWQASLEAQDQVQWVQQLQHQEAALERGLVAVEHMVQDPEGSLPSSWSGSPPAIPQQEQPVIQQQVEVDQLLASGASWLCLPGSKAYHLDPVHPRRTPEPDETDLLAAGGTAKKTEQQPNEVQLVLWNQLLPDQQFTVIPRTATTHEGRWSFLNNCAQAETTAEFHQGLLLNF
ncbi:hypothetical protein PAL_GLEAN10017291 [Pteropus alecto]|uniref:Uncharacterized protein n=1 Tax=Pteropus alecto TaxID=9402 RepID=L5K385_PTEAL|nr:hypothetical protein PAL_GLEAN10017291 [Pteropus alecto]